jgi:hypothetical protein
MEFTLTYSGPLKASGSVKDKHELRRNFHNQLLVFWSQEPFCGIEDSHPWLFDDTYEGSMINCICGFRFVSLITSKLHLVGELDVTLLRPETPGQIVTQCGDIDNRLKTLLDALRIPKNDSEIPSGDKPRENENPFYCLLEDDNLITRLNVKTDRLLETSGDSSLVRPLIHVQSNATVKTDDNIYFS